MKNERLVNWDSLLLRISGERVTRLAGEEVKKRSIPLRSLSFTFDDGALTVDGSVQKLIQVPFRMVIREIVPENGRIFVTIAEANAFGILPIPQLAIEIVGKRFSRDEMYFEVDRNAFVIVLDRFLPPFADIRLDRISVVRGGLAIELGPGGADPPIPGG